MNFGELKSWFTLIIAVGGIVYNLITRLNHVDHLRKNQTELKNDFKNHIADDQKYRSELWKKIDIISDDVAYMKGKMNGRKK